LAAVFVFAAAGGWNLWTAWSRGTVVLRPGDISRDDDPVMFWIGVVVYTGFLVSGSAVLLFGLYERLK
jgi:hypothetical protein